MTIDEAIRTKEEALDRMPYIGTLEERQADRLGIEALKFYKTIKADGLRSKDFRLSGETKE